jgi:hypothetical protein
MYVLYCSTPVLSKESHEVHTVALAPFSLACETRRAVTDESEDRMSFQNHTLVAGTILALRHEYHKAEGKHIIAATGTVLLLE